MTSPTTPEHIPGTVTIAKSDLIGGARNEGQNIGYVKDGCGTSNEITVDQAGVYAMTLPVSRYGDGVLNVTVTDQNNGVEAETNWTLPAESSNYTEHVINLEGELTTGRKVLKLVFNANHGGFIANYKDMVLEKIADHCATFRGVAIDGQDVTAGEGYDWNCNLPLDFAATTTVKTNANANAIITATAVDGDGNAVAVTDNGDGTYTLPHPEGSTQTIVTFNVSAKEGVVVFHDTYTPASLPHRRHHHQRSHYRRGRCSRRTPGSPQRFRHRRHSHSQRLDFHRRAYNRGHIRRQQQSDSHRLCQRRRRHIHLQGERQARRAKTIQSTYPDSTSTQQPTTTRW